MKKENLKTRKTRQESHEPCNATTDEMRDMRAWMTRMMSSLPLSIKQATITCSRQGWGKMRVDMAVTGMPLRLGGKIYTAGIGSHGECDLQITLPAGSRRLTGLCGVDDSDRTRGAEAQTFSIEVDGKEIWNSGPLDPASQALAFDVPVRNARVAWLKVRGPVARAHVDWVNLQTDGVPVRAVRDALLGEAFCFRYNGKLSIGLLPGWTVKTKRIEDKGVVRHELIWTDPKTGLVVTCAMTEYTSFPVVEWVVRLKNTSSRPTPLIEDLRSMDLRFGGGRFPYLNYRNGDYFSADGYEPFRVSLAHGEEYRFAPMGGRGTNRAWPYYNIDWEDTDKGLIAVVGWAGQWASRIAADPDCPGGVHITAGQQTTNFRLLPGEEVRTPSSLLMFHRGGRDRSQNLWRRWYREHVMPRPGVRPMQPHLVGCGTDEGEEFTGATEANQIQFIDKWTKQKIPFDVWWIDAGWYPCMNEAEKKRRWTITGTWRPDPDRFPRGFKPVSDALAGRGAKLLLWFEPERVRPGTELDIEHPEWLLRSGGSQDRLLNLGNPKCRRWLTNHVCRFIRKNGIGIYRQDFNFEPLPYWQANDKQDRQGISENLYVQGYLKYWDDLLARNPGLWIDSCASGGRRNDLDTMRRSVPLHYSDYGYGDHPVKLAFHDGLFNWLPYFKESSLAWDVKGDSRFDHEVDRYAYHCGFGPMFFPTIDIRRDDYDYATSMEMIRIWQRAAPLMLDGDYYALSPVNRAPDKWVVRQFDRPETGEGFVQAIRLPADQAQKLIVYPKALSKDTTYIFENPETGVKYGNIGVSNLPSYFFNFLWGCAVR